MNDTRRTLNELLVNLFNNILAIEEANLQNQHVSLSMTEVHILEAIEKSESNMMSAVAKYLMITQGTLTVSVSKLEKKPQPVAFDRICPRYRCGGAGWRHACVYQYGGLFSVQAD